MRKFPLILILLLVTGYVFLGCNNNNCPLTTIALGHFDFVDSKTSASVSLNTGITITGFTIADVTVNDTLADGTVTQRVVKDSILNDTLYNSPTSSMSLPLSYNSRTTYVIHYTESMRDTIVLEHKNIPYIENIDCGTMMFYKVDKIEYTTNVLDSVVMINPDITNEEKKNFNIYYLAD